MHVDWKLIDRSDAGDVSALSFQRVRWVRTITGELATPPVVECDFDHPDAVAEEIAGRMALVETAAFGKQFEVGKTYRMVFE